MFYFYQNGDYKVFYLIVCIITICLVIIIKKLFHIWKCQKLNIKILSILFVLTYLVCSYNILLSVNGKINQKYYYIYSESQKATHKKKKKASTKRLVKESQICYKNYPTIYNDADSGLTTEDLGFFEKALDLVPDWLIQNASYFKFSSENTLQSLSSRKDNLYISGVASPSDNGIYLVPNNGIYPDSKADYLNTLIHELGHLYDFNHNITKDTSDSNQASSLLSDSQSKVCSISVNDFEPVNCSESLQETFADSTVLYVLKPNKMPKELKSYFDSLPK